MCAPVLLGINQHTKFEVTYLPNLISLSLPTTKIW